jgi:hypothetical protein
MIFQLKPFQTGLLIFLGWTSRDVEMGRDISSNKLLFSWRGGDIE